MDYGLDNGIDCGMDLGIEQREPDHRITINSILNQ